MKMKKITAIMLVILLAVGLSACGASKAQAPQAMDETSFRGFNGGGKGSERAAEAEMPSEDMPAFEEGGGGLTSIQNMMLSKANVKLIYTAYMTLQSENFDESSEALQKIIADMGGYIENSNIYYGSGGRNLRNASYTVRVPEEKYSPFLENVGNTCHVVELSQNVEDVSLSYGETESRLETLKTKHARLIELLSKAQNMADIIEIESALSDCESQMNDYSQTLKHYDSFINFSTVNIELREVIKYDDSVTEDQGFSARLGRTFKRGIDNFLSGLDDFVMFLSYNLVTIAVMAVVTFFVVKAFKKAGSPEKKAERLAKKEMRKAAKTAKKEARRIEEKKD